MANLTGKQFRMVTNMKAGRNSQGTLFQGGNPSPATGKPWPRRYSPQRRDEVVGALRNADDLREDLKYPTAEGWSFAAGERLHQQAHGISAIARSTVPVEHLGGNLRINWGTGKAIGNELGEYHPHGVYGTKKEPMDPDISIHRIPGNEHGPTVIHEIGHHVSRTVYNYPHSRYNTPGHRGAEEGFAENYSEQHFRDNAGKPNLDFQTSPAPWAESESIGAPQHAFINAFVDKRRMAPGALRARAGEIVDGIFAKERGHQEELLSKVHSGGADWREQDTHHWDYNEHAPAHLSRQITGRQELDRMDQRTAEKDIFLNRGIRTKAGPQFNVFGHVDLNR